jgi:hypothetical protein
MTEDSVFEECLNFFAFMVVVVVVVMMKVLLCLKTHR